MKKEKVTIIGTLNMELILAPLKKIPSWGKQVLVEKFDLAGAGSAARVAFPLARLGIKSFILSNIGDDPYGKIILENLKDYDLSREGVEIIKGERTGFCLSVVKNNGRRFFLSHLGSLSSFGKEAIERYYSLIQKTDYLLLTSYFNLPNLGLETTKMVFKRAKKEGKVILLDPGWDPSGWPKKHREEILSLLEYVDIFLPNEEEAKILTGSGSSEKAAKLLISMGPQEVIIKLGKKGSLAQDRNCLYQEEAFPARVVDTTAAGETFNAGILYGLIKKMNLGSRLKYANALASLVISMVKKEYPNAKEVEKLLKGTPCDE